MKLVYGTGNPAKLEAMRRRLAGLDFEIAGLKDMEKEAPQVPEDGRTPLESSFDKIAQRTIGRTCNNNARLRRQREQHSTAKSRYRMPRVSHVGASQRRIGNEIS